MNHYVLQHNVRSFEHTGLLPTFSTYHSGTFPGTGCIFVIVANKHLPISCYGILLAFHAPLDVAPPKLFVKGPESASASSSPILATLLALNGVPCSGGRRIVDVMAIISSVVSKALFI